MTKKELSLRIKELRERRCVSCREMSAALGQSPSYVNNIENGIIAPSMQMFFDICNYFHIRPEQFFQKDNPHADNMRELSQIMEGMSSEQWDVVLSVARMLQAQSTSLKKTS